jgi:hypothetical protein
MTVPLRLSKSDLDNEHSNGAFLGKRGESPVPRPVLNIGSSGSMNLSASTAGRTTVSLQGPRLHSRLRQKRAKPYVDAVSRVLVKAQQSDVEALKALISEIGNEFGDLAIEQRPDGIMGQVTRLDEEGVYHPTQTVAIWDLTSRRWDEPSGFVFLIQDAFAVYEAHQPMPNGLLERARSLALHSNYLLVELYADTLRAVCSDGSVSVIEK